MAGPARHAAGGLDVIGRAAEQRRIEQLCAPGSGVTAIVLTGEAGIGKTALWEWSISHLAADGTTVLASRAVKAEARLPWAGLADLLAGVSEDVLGMLPPPQRHALQVVLLQVSGGEIPDERTVGTAVGRVLTELARAAAVLIAVDDLPYLDPASAGALRFALRRLDHADRVRVIGTVRGIALTVPPVDAFPPERVAAVHVGPMPLDAVFELLDVRLGLRLTRPVVLRVHETAGGNPLYALELARALQRWEIVPVPGAPLPVPDGLAALVDERVRSLPPEVLSIVAGTAAAWRLTDAGLDGKALTQAVQAGLVLVDPGRRGGARIIRPFHPLLSAAAYTALPPARLQALHERLAAGTDDPVEFAQHTALAGVRPPVEMAAVLDAGVTAAIAAGTPDVAADLSRLALDHTDPGPERADRLGRLADALSRAGDNQGALEAQREAVMLTPAGPVRARRRIRVAEILVEVAGWDVAVGELKATFADADGDPAVTAEVLLTLAQVTTDITEMVTYANRAVVLLDSIDDTDAAVLSAALSHEAGARFRAGYGLDHGAYLRAIEIEKNHLSRRLSDRADAGYAALLKYADDVAAAEERLLVLLEEARFSGDLPSIAYVLAHLPQISLWRGQFDEAERYIREHLVVAEQGMLAFQLAQAQYNMGILLANRGRLDEAEQMLGAAVSATTATVWDRQRAAGGLGFVELSRGNVQGAVRHLDEWHELLTAMHFGEPGYSRSHLDYLSALVGVGRIEDAERFLHGLTEQVARSGRGSAGAVAHTGRALIEASHGHLSAALAAIAEALSWYETSPLRLDRARTLLIAGRIQRRATLKRLAQASIREAAGELRSIGALAWAAQADAELARVNVRRTAPTALTETERRIAELAATGLTNREIAHQMFLSPKTIESNIARVYQKLGIRSRAELGSRLGRTGQDWSGPTAER